MNLQTPLARVKGLGSAHQGSHHWLMQRITAVTLAVLFIWFAFSFACLLGKPYPIVQAWVSTSYNTVLLLSFLIAGFYHAILGLQVVIEDYVSSPCKRIVILIAMKITLSILGISAVVAVLRTALGS